MEATLRCSFLKGYKRVDADELEGTRCALPFPVTQTDAGLFADA